MRRKAVVIAVVLLGVVLMTGFVVGAVEQSGALDTTVYTVPQVQAELARHPGEWQGRAIRLRGTVMTIPCPVSACPLYFQEARRVTSVPLLIPSFGVAPPWEAALRRVPILGTLVPVPRQADYGVASVYRARIVARARGTCAWTCYAAVLLNSQR